MITDFFKKTFWLSQYRGEKVGFGGENYSQKVVNQQSVLALSAVWACVRLISESIASLPLGLYEKDSRGDKVDKSGEDLYRIIHDKPNADMTAFNFWQCVIAVLLLRGNAILLKTYRGTGEKRALISIEHIAFDRVTWKVNEVGAKIYTISSKDGSKQYSEDLIMHLVRFSLDGRCGLSVINAATNTFGNAMSQEESAGKLYANGMRPAGALKMSQVLKKEQRDEIRKSITEQVGGVSKTGGIILLEGGMEFQSLAIPPEDAQMIQSRGFSVEEICRWFGVPPSLIGHTEKSTTWGTGLEQLNLGFLTYTLTPIIKNIEGEIKRSLIPVGSKLFAEYNVEGFLRADSSARASLYSSFTQNGIMTRAEVRKKENLPYIEGTDTLTVQSALTNLDMLGEPPPENRTIEDSAKV